MLLFAMMHARFAPVFRPVRNALAWLLELHRPVPERSEAEITAEVQRNYRWNFSVNLLDGAFFWFGASFMSSATILPLFVSKLTTSPLAIGLLAVFAQASWFLPQLFTANLVERLARKKPVVVNLGLFMERLPVWGLVLAASQFGVNNPPIVTALDLNNRPKYYEWPEEVRRAGTYPDPVVRGISAEDRNKMYGRFNRPQAKGDLRAVLLLCRRPDLYPPRTGP